MSISLLVLIIVFFAIAFRQFFRIPLHIWQIMAMGAIVVIAFGEIGIKEAIFAINFEVIIFLLGMFMILRVLEETNLLISFLERFLVKYEGKRFLLAFVYTMGIASAIFLNDTIAIIGTPATIYLAKRKGLSCKLLLMGLCFSITIGSVFSPIGNPQNLLIATEGLLVKPFLTFFYYLALPSMLCLALVGLFLYLFCHRQKTQLSFPLEVIEKQGANLCKWVIVIMLGLIGYNIMISLVGWGPHLPIV